MVREAGVWRDLEAGAPDLAQPGLARLNATRVALLGTLRPDASPRISSVEPYLVEGQLMIGSMTWSRMTSDLRRDPRYVLHSAVTGPDTGEGDFKVYGSAIEVDPSFAGTVANAWWSELRPDKAVVFSLGIALAVFIDWDIQAGLMTVHRWSPRSGYSRTTRTYP